MASYACLKCTVKTSEWDDSCHVCGASRSIVREEELLPVDAPEDDGIMSLEDVGEDDTVRLPTGFVSVDTALGGGFAYPSVIQFAGQPGIGKSTLLLQLADRLADHGVLIATSEERPEAIGTRAKRLHCKNMKKVKIISTESPEELKSVCLKLCSKFVIVDSLQGLRSEERRHSQYTVRETALDLVNFAHATKTYEGEHEPFTMILVCHVTKSLDAAGVKEIEHMCDVAAWFRGERTSRIRRFEMEKNRFGATHERAVFSMGDRGLTEITGEEMKEIEKEEKHEAPTK